MEQLRRSAHVPDAPMPVSRPTLFVDDPSLDLTLSVNRLSQLSYVPGKYLDGRRDEPTIDIFLRHLVEAHLDYLCRLPGRTASVSPRISRR
jgi:hypothetical protein